MRRLVRFLTAALLAVGAVLGAPAAGAADTGMLRLAHLSPDAPSVDVYVDSVSDPAAKVTLTGVGYGTVSAYQVVPPGTYTVSMRATGADPSTPPALSTTVDVHPGSALTVAGVGRFAGLELQVLDDDLTPPPAGQARARVLNAAGSTDAVSVALPGGQTLASGLAFGKAGDYVNVPAGGTTLQVTPDGSAATALPVSLAAGSVSSVLVLDRSGGGLTVTPVLDAASPGVVPVGGVETGAGGTAGSPAGLAALGVAAAAGVALLTTARFRLPRRGRGARHRAAS